MFRKAENPDIDNGQFVRITRWALETELLDTQYGSISFLEWLNKEKDRIQLGTKREMEIRQDKDGKIALYSTYDNPEGEDFPGVRRYTKKLSKKESKLMESLS
ncbi:MAG: hypothetical protein Q8Q33_00890 [Chlamydiota bacterium]|nr:hypothetical protein [Chlamydiota bacterium]